MHIDAIDVFHLALPLVRPCQIAGRHCDRLETVVVRMSGGGMSGWGEASPGSAPLLGGEWAGGAFALLRDWLAPAVAGATLDSGEALAQRLAPFRGNRYAKAALDAAWWDLNARQQGRPLYTVLGGSPEAVEVGVTFDRMESIDEFLAAIGRALEAGFPRVKLKLRPGWALEMLRVVRQEFPTQTFHVDCEGSLGLEHMEMLCRLDDFGLAMIEQPLAADDLVGNAMLQEAVRTPICLDEGITTPAQAEMALDLKSCRLVNLKADRVGGLTAAVAIHESCRASDVGCWAGGVPQSAVGQRIALALAATARGVYPADYFPADEVLAVNLAEPSRARRDPTDGRMCVPLWSTPGLGIEPDGEILRKHSLQAVHYAGGAASQASGPR